MSQEIESVITRQGIVSACEKCNEETPVRMKQGRLFWVRCFMCGHETKKARSLDAALRNWNETKPRK